ncbi:hypothetical protein HRF80_12910 [Enterococcus faecalis]|uniref:hypothetical protein n=1 Tax=Enterococcus TaxID=1350 RepID=UPI00032FEEE7|nr:hypothetical protein [Enterococcus faecalis]EIA6415060.1 hypothetical protein [Enterococcus faecalis]EJX8073684.1 hypothetical protein [Enterococcus faecalis]ELU9006800.1 hypothetical protein [Enterococcus faecalis]EOJ79205.1 hypothetical protein WOA_02076 [Enterococcus faecalis EnGen0356]MDK0526614.1 hypothetical protein [Enterococcus faecalis]
MFHDTMLFFYYILIAISIVFTLKYLVQLLLLNKKYRPTLTLQQLKIYNKKIQNYLESENPIFKIQKKVTLCLFLVINLFLGLVFPNLIQFINQNKLENKRLVSLYIGIASIILSILVLFNLKMDINKDKILCQYLKRQPKNELGVIQINKGEKEKILNVCKKFGISLLVCGLLFVIHYFF